MNRSKISVQALDYASDAREIFVLPDAVTQIKKLIDDEAATMKDIAENYQFRSCAHGANTENC